MEEDFIVREMVSKVAFSIVTVATVTSEDDLEYTNYGTGFVLASEKNYALVFTCLPPEYDRAKEFLVYFEGNSVRNKAHLLLWDKTGNSSFLILIVQTAKQYAPVIFSENPLDRELVFIIGATGGIKLNATGKIVDETVGTTAAYRGKVTVSTYAATDFKFANVRKSETFFELTCCVHDEIITLSNIDKKAVRQTNIILCAPVVCFDGKVGGIVFSPGNWGDVKCGMHAKEVISHIQRLCGKKKWQVSSVATCVYLYKYCGAPKNVVNELCNLQEDLKKHANDWLMRNHLP